MLLLECLSRLPADQFSRIAASAGLREEGGRTAVAQELAACLLDRAWLQGLLADLSDDEWAALKVVYFNGGDQGITVELCHQIVNLLSGRRRKSSARAVEDLQNRGLIFPRTQNYRQVFFIPTDLTAVLGDILNRQMIHRLSLPPTAAIRPVASERDLVEDLHRFLAYVYKNEITLTQQGQIFKRHLRALLDLLMTGDEDEESLVGRYPEPLGLLVGYALDRRLIMREEGRLLPAPALAAWVDGPAPAKLLDLFGYWQDRYYYQDLQTFLSVMRTVGQKWVSVGRLVTEIEPLINPSQRGSFVLRLRHHLTTFLGPMGLVEIGAPTNMGTPPGLGASDEQIGSNDLVCRLTLAGVAVLNGTPPASEAGASPGLLLQATFEAIAPRPVPAKLLWMLELTADLVKRTDRTLTYRLDRQSVYRALKTGLTGEAILAFLREHSATGVPQNVAFDLAAWAAAYGQVYLQQMTVLRCATPLLAQQIKASRRTSRFILGELTPLDLIVAGQEHKELLEALQADGLMPRPDIERLS